MLKSGRNIVKSFEYKFIRLIPPENILMGVMCDDISGLDGLKGLKLLENDKLTEFISLNPDNFPEDIKSLRAFDFILLSNFDTSVLSDNQRNALSKWVDEGRLLLIGTGSNWKKVYSGFPNGLKPYIIDGSGTINESKGLKTFTGVNDSLPGLKIVTKRRGKSHRH